MGLVILLLLLLLLLLLGILNGRDVGELIHWFSEVELSEWVLFVGHGRIVAVRAKLLGGMWKAMRIDMGRCIEIEIVVEILL